MIFLKKKLCSWQKVVKKDVYNAKIEDIEDKVPNISNLASTAAFNAKINYIKNEIPSVTNLATNDSHNAKINEVKKEIPSIINLATTIGLTAFEDEISDVSDLVKKADYDADIIDIKNNISQHLIIISSRKRYQK